MAEMEGRAANGAADERPIGELARLVSEQSTRLAGLEVELAKAELAEKGTRLGIGAGAFGGAGAIGFYALGALTATFILALSEGMAAWLASLVVAVVYAAIAGVLALVGKRRVEEGSPPIPERAVDSSKRDVEAAKRGVREARS
jgi:hypothetical protein